MSTMVSVPYSGSTPQPGISQDQGAMSAVLLLPLLMNKTSVVNHFPGRVCSSSLSENSL